MSQVIVQSNIGCEDGCRHGEQEGRIDIFFANFIVEKDKSIVKFSFWDLLVLQPTARSALESRNIDDHFLDSTVT